MNSLESTPDPREAAFLAAWASLQEQGYASESLEQWQRAQQPTAANARLARQITYGTLQMASALDYLALQLTDTGSLKIKPKERCLLRSAIYQAHFMDRIPIYSIVNESVRIARKYMKGGFDKFLNALLRSYATKKPTLPSTTDPKSLAVSQSYPRLYVDALIGSYGLEKAQEILTLGNKPAKVMVRIRNKAPVPPAATLILQNTFKIASLSDPGQLSTLTTSSDYYTQNVTPAYLIEKLARHTPPPATILDLCAAPGGKTIAVSDLYPNASICANDANDNRLKVLRENLHKYHVDATVSCQKGEVYTGKQKFDLIILDVPCSNSGVLNKRPEARWRLSQESLQQLNAIQEAILKNAITLLTPSGSIWYLTCSILPSENEAFIKSACSRLKLTQSDFMETILPNDNGWDGGFACLLY